MRYSVMSMKSRRIFCICAVWVTAIAILFPVSVEAQRLPNMHENPWRGFFSGYERKNFEFGINYEGQSEIYLLAGRSKKRVGQTRTIKIYAEVLVETAPGKFSTKRLKEEEGFATEMKAGLDHKEVKFTAESIGDAKVEITVKYDRNRIIMDGRILDRGTLKNGKLYLVYKVKVPAMYGRTYDSADGKKLKRTMRRDKVRFTRAENKKRVSLKTYEAVDLRDDDKAKGGVTDIAIDMSAQEGNVFLFTTLDGTGVIEFENKYFDKKAPLWKGYTVKWKREFTETEDAPKGDSKAKPTKGISPFVIEIK